MEAFEEVIEKYTKIQVYKVGRMDGLNEVCQKLKRMKEVKALKLVEKMKEEHMKKMDFATFMLNEGFYDF